MTSRGGTGATDGDCRVPRAVQRAVTRVLFVTWDGPQSAYLESLFLPIFSELRNHGYCFHVLQFTWASAAERDVTRKAAERGGIAYSSISVLRRPLTLGSVVTSVAGAYHVVRYARKHRIDVLMPRSILPALAALLARMALPHVRLVFDADGLPIDERIEFAGMSPHCAATVVMRDIEAAAVRRADVVLTRSREANRILIARAGAGSNAAKYFRVPNCRNEADFRPMGQEHREKIRTALGIPMGVPVLVYAGSSLSGKYDGAGMLRFFSEVAALQSDARFLILTASPSEAAELIARGQPDVAPSCHVLRAAPQDVPLYLSACDLGVAFIHPSLSMKAAAAVKVGEYLLCGLPVVATSGIGDADETLSPDISFLLADTTPNSLRAAARWFYDTVLADARELAHRARRVGIGHYGFGAGISQYRAALDSATMHGSRPVHRQR